MAIRSAFMMPPICPRYGPFWTSSFLRAWQATHPWEAKSAGPLPGFPLILSEGNGEVLHAHLPDLSLLFHDLVEVNGWFGDGGQDGIIRLGQAGNLDPVLLGQFGNDEAGGGITLLGSLDQGFCYLLGFFPRGRIVIRATGIRPSAPPSVSLVGLFPVGQPDEAPRDALSGISFEGCLRHGPFGPVPK